MRANAFLVGGTGRDVTTLMREVEGLLVKDGAEGVCAAATGDGVGIAVKINDGSGRARTPVLVEVLTRLGITVDTTNLTSPDVLGHGRPVGAVRAVL
jgi:L-asparaginase II